MTGRSSSCISARRRTRKAHGEYQFADTGEVVLLAGDRDGDTLEIEESNDGTNITGVDRPLRRDGCPEG